MANLSLWLGVAAGGGLGSVARYAITRTLHAPPAGFPWGTFTANLIGCLAIGVCYVLFERHGSPWTRDFVRVGLLGGLTTFSSYSIESIALFEKGHPGLAAANLIGSVVGGLLAAGVGLLVARTFVE